MRTHPVPWFTMSTSWPASTRQELCHRSQVLLGHVDRDRLHGLVQHSVDLPGDHLGLADGQLEALAAHGLHEHRQLELAAGVHLPCVGPFGREGPAG